MPTPKRPGSVMLSNNGGTFTLHRDGLWHSTSGNGYMLEDTLRQGWHVLWDAANLDSEVDDE